jgi:hypothetical protein
MQPANLPTLLECEFTPTVDDLRRAAALPQQPDAPHGPRGLKLILIWAGSLTFFAVVASRIDGPLRVLPEIGAALMLGLGLLFAFLYPRAKHEFKRLAKRCPHIVGPQSFRATSEVLVYETEISLSATMLAQMKVRHDSEVAKIEFPGGSWLVLPAHGHFGPETFATFCDKLLALIEQARATRETPLVEATLAD